MYFHLEQKSFCMPLVFLNGYFGTDRGKWLVDLPIDSLRVDLAIQVITFAHSVPFIFLFGYNQKFFLSVTKIALIQSCFFYY